MSQDTEAAFRQFPGPSRLLSEPDTVIRAPNCRKSKASLEDTFFANTLKTPGTLEACVSFYKKPAADATIVREVSTLNLIGDGLNGHPKILHGGIAATFIDESMGVYLSVNIRSFRHLEHTVASPRNATSFTADLKIRYLRPIHTPGVVLVTSTWLRTEGRKEWIRTELKQWVDSKDGSEGELVTCTTAEGLFITPRETRPIPARKNKL